MNDRAQPTPKMVLDTLSAMQDVVKLKRFLDSVNRKDMTLKEVNVLSMLTLAMDGVDALLDIFHADQKHRQDGFVQAQLFAESVPPDRAAVAKDMAAMFNTWLPQGLSGCEFKAREDGGIRMHAPGASSPATSEAATPVELVAADAVRDALVKLDTMQVWPSVRDLETWHQDELAAAHAWATTGDVAGVAPEPLNSFMATMDESLPARILYSLYSADNGIAQDAFMEAFAQFSDEDLWTSTWALIHTDLVSLQRPEMIFRAAQPELDIDIAKMLADQPELGTEDGLPVADIKVIELPSNPRAWFDAATSLLEQVLITRRSLVIRHLQKSGAEPDVAVSAVESLEAAGTFEKPSKGYVATVGFTEAYLPESRDRLKEIYEDLTGKKAGKKRADTLRSAILSHLKTTGDQKAETIFSILAALDSEATSDVSMPIADVVAESAEPPIEMPGGA